MKCGDGHYYVGETKRLYRRFWEHTDGRGGVNTSEHHEPEGIVALYKVSTLVKFLDYNFNVVHKICNIYFNECNRILEDFNANTKEFEHYEDNYLFAENSIAECLMLSNKDNWQKIRGGKYTRFDIEYAMPLNKEIENLPLCSCGLPCDIKKNETNDYLYFRCAKKNMWADMKDIFDSQDEPCNFFMKYTKDIEYIIYFEQRKKIILELVKKSAWLEKLEDGQYEYCVGGCGKEYDGDNTIRYSGKAINLCFDCFINKNDELAKTYNKPQCLLSL